MSSALTENETRVRPLIVALGQRRAVLLTLLTLLYVALIWTPFQRHLWFDELLTYQIAKVPSTLEMLRIAPRWDLNPPLLHLLSHCALRIAHGSPLAIRIPSVLAFYFAGVFLFLYSLRKLPFAWSALPVLLMWYGPMFGYATEARPYALLCFWFCALLFIWDRVVEKRTGFWLMMAAFCAAGLLLSHVFGVLTVFTFLFAEGIRARRSRRVDWPLWIALTAPLLLTLLYIPLYGSYKTIVAYPAAFQAGIRNLTVFYWHNLAGLAICVLAAILAAWLAAVKISAANANTKAPPLSMAELALLGSQALLPVLLNAVLALQHGAFWGRYCITSVVALCFVAGYLIAGAFRWGLRSGYAAISAAALITFLHGFIWPSWKQKMRPTAANAALLAQIRPNLPFVTASGLTFVEMAQYENAALRARLFFLQDRAAALEYAHATMFNDLGDFHDTFHLAGRVEPYNVFVRRHSEFLVLGTPGYPEDWLLKKLAADGAHITLIGRYATVYKDKQLFDVQVNEKK